MVNSFFIALALAIGSTAVLLSILYVGVRIFAPRKLDERIPTSIPMPAAECSAEQPTSTATIRALASYEAALVPAIRGIDVGDAIIASVVMPGVSGLEAAAQIKRLSQLGNNVPMLVLTTLGPYPGKVAPPQQGLYTPFSQPNPEVVPVH
jgi:hypothetical protein